MLTAIKRNFAGGTAYHLQVFRALEIARTMLLENKRVGTFRSALGYPPLFVFRPRC